MKLTYGQLLDGNFSRGFSKIANCPQLKSPKLAYQIAKIHKRVQEERDLVATLHEKMVKVHCKLDEKGNIAPMTGGQPGTFEIREEAIEAWKTDLKEFNSIEFDIDFPPMVLNDQLMVANLSPAEISGLEPILKLEEDQPVAKALKSV